MGIRIPLQTILSLVDTGTTGVNNTTFQIPQDASEILCKVYTTATFTGTSPTCDIYLQTSDDGGTTWYDVCHFKQITAAIVNQNAMFQAVSVGFANQGGRGLGAYIGSVAASTAAASTVTGLPMIGPLGRVSVQYGGTQLTNSGINVVISVPSQDRR